MITWIENHLIRHGRWIFITLLAVVIVAFVGTIGNTPGCTTNRSNYQAVDFYGYDLNSERDMRPISQRLSLITQLNKQNNNSQQMSDQLLSRIALLDLADTIGIPAPSQGQLVEFLQAKALFVDESGAFNRDLLTRFVDDIEANPNLPNGILALALEEDYRVMEAMNTLSGPGYVLDAEARIQAERYQTNFKIQIANFDYATFSPEITPEEDALKEYYNSNSQRYEIPESLEASYLKFNASDYLGTSKEADADADALRDHFIANRASFVAEYEAKQSNDSTEEADSEKPPVKFEMVQDAVKESYLLKLAARKANEAAQNFAYQLYNLSIPFPSDAFDSFLEENGLALNEIKPFNRNEVSQRNLPSQMLRDAFDLNESRYYSDPYQQNNDFVVLIFNDRIPANIPPYESVKDLVSNNYTEDEKRRLFYEKGTRLQEQLQTDLTNEMSFAEAATALNLKTEDFESFQASNPPQNLNPAIMQNSLNLNAGDVSPMIQSGSGGTFIYLENKEIPAFDAEDESLQQANNFLQYTNTMLRIRSLSQEIITAGMPASE